MFKLNHRSRVHTLGTRSTEPPRHKYIRSMGSGEYFYTDIIMLTLLQISNLRELKKSSDRNDTPNTNAGLNLNPHGRGRPFSVKWQRYVFLASLWRWQYQISLDNDAISLHWPLEVVAFCKPGHTSLSQQLNIVSSTCRRQTGWRWTSTSCGWSILDQRDPKFSIPILVVTFAFKFRGRYENLCSTIPTNHYGSTNQPTNQPLWFNLKRTAKANTV